MKNIALGFKQYIQDYDEKYPAKDTWTTAIYTYTKSDQVLRCPSAGNTEATVASKIDYLYNEGLHVAKESRIEATAVTVLNAEAARGVASSGAAASAPTRHFDGSNYSFVDGHVKWLKPAAVIATASTTQPTFDVPISAGAQAAIVAGNSATATALSAAANATATAIATANGSWASGYSLKQVYVGVDTNGAQAYTRFTPTGSVEPCSITVKCSLGGKTMRGDTGVFLNTPGNAVPTSTATFFGINKTGSSIYEGNVYIQADSVTAFGNGMMSITIGGLTRNFYFTP